MTIGIPETVVAGTPQAAWLSALGLLHSHGWELNNLIVQIQDPAAFDETLHAEIDRFARAESLLPPKDVAYTIFPHNLYRTHGDAARLFEAYNRPGGMFQRLQRRTGRWGTYFRRLTAYETTRGAENQLKRIIDCMNTRDTVCRAAYTAVIPIPGSETVRKLGAPCLNYIAVQSSPQPNAPPLVGLLAVYRNHDFLNKAYGNYWGLCHLVCFIAQETASIPGPLTCISSHAYVQSKKRAIAALLSGFRSAAS